MTKISELAVVSKRAKISADVEIGPYAIIEPDVEISKGVKIWPHAHICSGTSIGEGTEIHMGAVAGHLPQDLTFDKFKKTRLLVGSEEVLEQKNRRHCRERRANDGDAGGSGPKGVEFLKLQAIGI